MPLTNWYSRARTASRLGWERVGFETTAVAVLVVALFFQRLDHYLWLERGFPIPDLTFVLAALPLFAFAALLAYRGKLDLRHPSWPELTVMALFVVIGLTSIGAALTAHTPGRHASASTAVIAPNRGPYDLTVRNARVRQNPMRSGGSAVHFTPRVGVPSALGFQVGGKPIRIDPKLAYSYSVMLRTTSAPVRLSVLLRQRAPGTNAKPLDTRRRIKVGPLRWVRIVVTAEPARGARVLEPLILLPRLTRKTTLEVASAQLTTETRVPFAIPTVRGASYALHARGAEVSQHLSGASGVWTVVAKSRPGRPGMVWLGPRVRTPPAQHDLVYVFRASLHSTSKATPLTVGLLSSPTPPGAKPVEATQQVTFGSSGWAQVTLTTKATPGKVLEPFVAFPPLPRPIEVVLWNARLAAQPPVILTRHFGQSVKTIAHFAYLALIALLLGRILTPALMRRAFAIFFVLAVGAAVLAVLQAIDLNVLHTGASQALNLVSRNGTGFVRPCSIFSEPALLGYFALLGAVVGLWLQGSRQSRWIWIGIAVCVLAILLAAAAGPVVALVPVALYLGWRASRIWRRFWRELAVLFLVAIAVLAFLPAGRTLTSRANSIISGSDHSAQFRYAYDSGSIQIWKLAPLTGVGAGNTRFYLPSFVHLSFLPNDVARFQSVNTYLAVLSEDGVFGLLALVAMLLALFAPLRTRLREGWWVTEAPILLFIVAFFFIDAFAYPIFWFWVGSRLAQLRQLEGLEPVESTRRQGVRAELGTA